MAYSVHYWSETTYSLEPGAFSWPFLEERSATLTSAAAATGAEQEQVGEIHATRVDVGLWEDRYADEVRLLDALDFVSQDLARAAVAVLGPESGEPRDEFLTALGPFPAFLFISRFVVRRDLRSQGLGTRFFEAALPVMAADAGLVLLEPLPFADEWGYHPGEAIPEEMVERLRGFYQRQGFRPLGATGLWYRDSI
ncbi:hypothetical protein LIP_3577 [Limnochorda pilosa]|uniref:N-acetyltransferase domain-containing protein n=1 Tax=Limnochorda pilosa TaxID=1555112 RepID=A0A0K2SQI0_LIMPI|nr:hypothetical protein LIP_3577 [Limnochorda pilosa]